MTKDTEEFSQFTDSVACREYTLPRDEDSSEPKGWNQGNTQKIGPVLEVTTNYLQSKYGVEIRIESVNKDNSHSWVRISHGLNKLVTDLSNNKENDNTEQETSEMQFEEYAVRLNASDFASRSKAKATKPRRRTSACSSTRTAPICERIWTDIEPGTISNIAYPMSEQLSTLLRHGHLSREDDGAIEFWRIKGISSEQIWALSTLVWRYVEEQDGKRPRQQEKYQCCTDPSRQEILLSPSSSRSFKTHIGCAINLNSVVNSRLIPGRQNLSQRQTVFFTSVDPMNKEHRDPDEINLNAPRLAW